MAALLQALPAPAAGQSQTSLRDLHTRHDEIRHRAAFRGCTSELLTVQQELVDYLLAKKHKLLGLEATAAPESDRNYNSFT